MRAGAYASLFFVLATAVGCSNGRGACATECGHGQICCDGACADMLVDAHNCGGCGVACAASETCAFGHCAAAVVDSGVRPDAGHFDAGGDTGAAGMCRPVCSASQRCCGTTCVSAIGIASGDGRSDPSFMNCGFGCTTMCDANTASRCGLPAGATSGTPQCLCGDVMACAGASICELTAGVYGCVDMQTDPHHCGSMTNVCTPGEACMAGMCACAAAGMHCTGAMEVCTATGCVDTTTDPMNCGGIGMACRTGETCSGGMCHCGSGARCPGGTLMGCGQLCCHDTCVYVDDYNCASCGDACGAGQSCGHMGFMTTHHCGDPSAGFFITCDAPDDAAVSADAGVTSDAGADAGADGSVDAGVDAAPDDTGVDAGM